MGLYVVSPRVGHLLDRHIGLEKKNAEGSDMVQATPGHHHSNGNNGNGYMKISDTGFRPLFTGTGFMSRYLLRMLH